MHTHRLRPVPRREQLFLPVCITPVQGQSIVYWGDGPKWREFEALKDVETLEQFFENRGYKTLGAGKIYHSQAPPWAPTSQVEPANWDFYYPSPFMGIVPIIVETAQAPIVAY